MKKIRCVLLIGHVWPEPNSSAAGRRSVALIEQLQELAQELHFACAAAPSEHRISLLERGVAEHQVNLNCDSFDELVARLQPQLVVFDRFITEEQFSWRVARACPDAALVLDPQDLHSLRDARHRALKQGGDVLQPGAALLNSELAQRELAAIWRCDLTLMISQAEISLLENHYAVAASLLHYLPLVSEGKLSEGGASGSAAYSHRRHFLCIGNFRHEPNWDALRYLRSELWPEIRRQLPGVECHVYGAYPPPKAQQLHSDKLGFMLRGWAPNAKQVMARARVCLAPLRFGAGQKGKLLEAMECGTPSVTTAIGAESMVDQPQHWGGFVADGATDFVDAAVALYRDEQTWLAAQQRGYRCLQAFDAGFHHGELRARLLGLVDELAAVRQRNFIGAMLRHHSLRSHQYMSQWIAAKQRLADSGELAG